MPFYTNRTAGLTRTRKSPQRIQPLEVCYTAPQRPSIAPCMADDIQLHTSKPANLYIEHDRLMDCIHCGLCLSQCPTYAEEGIEADSPRGRIYIMRSLAEGRAQPTPSLVQHLDLCLGCRACETACPSGVQYGHLIEQAREYLHDNYKRPWHQRLIGRVVETLFPYPNRMEFALLPVRIFRAIGVIPLLRKIGAMKLLGPLDDMEALLPPLPPVSKRLNFPELWKARGEKQGQVGMITGCVMQVMLSPVNEATARVLTKAGCDVAAPKTQGCCGALHAHTGAMHTAKEFAKKNIIAFEQWQKQNGPLEAIVINAAGCGSSLKEYTAWFKSDAEWEPRARAFSDKVKDASEFLAGAPYKQRLTELMEKCVASSTSTTHHSPLTKAEDVARERIPNTAGAATLQGAAGGVVVEQRENQLLATDGESSLPPDEATDGHRPHEPFQKADGSRVPAPAAVATRKVTYHDACHLAHGQGIRAQPREMLEAVPGLELVALPESEMCCGSAGSYNITQPTMAMQLLERKMKHIAKTGASVVVTGNPGCAMQIMLGAKKHGIPVEVRHPVEILDAATGDSD